MVKRVLNSNANAWKLYTFEMSNDCNKEWKQTAPRHTASVCWTITATKLAIGKLFYIVKITWFLVKLKVWQISWLVFSVYTQKMSNANARPTNWEAKIKQSNATKLPAKRKGSLFLSPRAWVLCLAVRLQFYCMVSHRICMRNGLVLEIVVSSAISAIAFLFRLFVHRSFFPPRLERIKLCGLHQRQCYMAPFDAQQGLFLRWCPQNMLADSLIFLPRTATLFSSTLFAFGLSVMFVFNNVRFQ